MAGCINRCTVLFCTMSSTCSAAAARQVHKSSVMTIVSIVKVVADSIEVVHRSNLLHKCTALILGSVWGCHLVQRMSSTFPVGRGDAVGAVLVIIALMQLASKTEAHVYIGVIFCVCPCQSVHQRQ